LVKLGAESIKNTFGVDPKWYRTAGAIYDRQAVDILRTDKDIHLAGFSLNLDDGGTASFEKIMERLSNANAYDVILLHGNRPHGNTAKAINQWLENKHPTLITIDEAFSAKPSSLNPLIVK
jgi:hypothetical protein